MRSEETPPRAACSPCWRSISWKAAAWSLAPPLTAASICGTPPASAREELWRLRGAKYVQSDLEGVFREVRRWLDQRAVLFSGTPCQVDGLYRYLGGRPENLTTCDLVCHGVPSPGVWEDMARSLEARRQQPLQAVRFRNKVAGWKDSHFTAVYGDGTVDTAPLFRTEYGPGLRPGAVPAAQLLPLSLRLHDPGGRSDTGGFLGPAAG